ncbi:DNA-binding transcriptional MerR regulator [Cytobacillus horneckiae]|uniref:MerR family transcriptional regulator n=1 Tax=Cytobacillus horneckiae TaxID=549687 RepID=A0A2N0ZBZ2_9BACI|nr:MerR family transcriptional regulator [Cytobacillus horneckiae]MBN6886047.1 MerR family transcriptional regulator [Cytobacillus horneckiae]MCM3176352.1 MerR family transcriptional regulator [Cytobacillus horneckiae]MEC1159170.1 MerR family transcriptional regulator [Cytobacillus horneckiae]MED2940751.1 MerR family transcriptional regulator [Cytobacillus horneckiae]PKG27028.1 MerR family transcriptional regulator [Cytobacillus horneckiae]
MLHINEVKKMSGVSVRTLRYYDKIELLKPASKTQGGHRLYSNTELKKLQQIQFLKTIGFQLSEIKIMLESEEWDWSISLMKQLSYVMSEKDRLSKIEFNLRELINGIAIEGEEFRIKKIMSLYTRDSKDVLTYDREELNIKNSEVLEKLPNMTSSDPDSLEWIALLGQLKKHMHLGYNDTRIQNIIKRMDEKKGEDFNDEDAFLDKLWDIRMSPEESKKHNLYPIDQEVLNFMEKAYIHYIAKKG